jgi:hypothetical protein
MDGNIPQRVWVCTFPDTACLGDDSSTSACSWAVSWFWRSTAACPSRFASAALSLSIIRVWSAMASLSKIARRVAASILAMSANDSNTYRSASSNQRGARGGRVHDGTRQRHTIGRAGYGLARASARCFASSAALSSRADRTRAAASRA